MNGLLFLSIRPQVCAIDLSSSTLVSCANSNKGYRFLLCSLF